MNSKTLIRICFILSRLVCLLLGFLILLTVAPHRNLWLMEHVSSELLDKGTTNTGSSSFVSLVNSILLNHVCLMLTCLIFFLKTLEMPLRGLSRDGGGFKSQVRTVRGHDKGS